MSPYKHGKVRQSPQNIYLKKQTKKPPHNTKVPWIFLVREYFFPTYQTITPKNFNKEAP